MVNTLTPLVNHHVSQHFFLAPRWRCGYRPIVAGPVFALLKPCWLMISSSFQRGFRHHTVDIHVDTTHKWWLMRFDMVWICVVVLSNIFGIITIYDWKSYWSTSSKGRQRDLNTLSWKMNICLSISMSMSSKVSTSELRIPWFIISFSKIRIATLRNASFVDKPCV